MPNQSDPNQNSPVSPVIPTAADLPPLPPEFQTPTTTTPASGQQPVGSAAPLNTPPVVSTPKKKFGGGRIIATILGILLLVGGVGAGIILTQQQQLFEQKATYGDSCTDSGDCGVGESCSGGICVSTGGTCITSQDCSGGMSCNNGQCIPPPSPTCDEDGDCGVGQMCNTTLGRCVSSNITCTGDLDCPTGQGCSGGKCVSLCSDSGDCSGGDICAQGKCIPPNNSCGRDTDPGAPVCCSGSCGGVLVCEGSNRLECNTNGVHCTIDADGCTDGSPPPEPPETPPPGANAQCSNVKAYSSTWEPLTTTQLAGLAPDAEVNFCVSGTESPQDSPGNFDKGRFKVNDTLYAETTTKRPGSDDYCQNYKIKATDKTVTVKARIHHTILGWKGDSLE